MRLPALICILLFSATLQSAHAECLPMTIAVDATERQALVCGNRKAGSAAPLVLALHGRGGNAENMASSTQIHAAWPEAIVAYPEGLTGNPAPYDPKGARRGWQINPGELNDRDVRFVDALLDALIEKHKPDLSRIYAVGHSNGARFAGILWAMRAPRFAAFAFSAGQADALIENAQPRPVFMSMGRRDEIIPFASQWPSIEYARKRLKTQSGSAFEYGYLRSEQGADGMELMTFIHPGGHVWPDGQTRHTVNFFKRHRLRSVP